MDEAGRVEGVAGGPPTQVAPGHAPQLVVDEGHDLVEGVARPGLVGPEKLRDRAGPRHPENGTSPRGRCRHRGASGGIGAAPTMTRD